MARKNNALTFGSGYNISAEVPIDSRMKVDHESDLINPDTWPVDTAPVYDCLTVTVKDTGNIWVLKDKTRYTDMTSGRGWVKANNSSSLDVLSKEKNKLLYSYDNETLEPDYLIPEKYNIAIVDNPDDFNTCKEKGIIEPDILTEFLQFSDTVYMPEYGYGRSYVLDNHLPPSPEIIDEGSNAGIGYGRWYEDEGDENHKNKFICNPVNSYEYTGYINPKNASYFNYDVLIGSGKGDTTGDWSGYALVNDDNAIPRHIVCSDGITYYRNTLYDLTQANGEKQNPIVGDLWCAWVSENQSNNTADVIYGKQVLITGKDYYEDEFPSGIVTVYKVLDIQTKTARLNYSSDFYKEVTVLETHEASGYIAVLNILTVNSTGVRWKGIENDAVNPLVNGIGTLSIFTNIIPCTEYDPLTFSTDLFRESKVVEDASKRCVLIKINDIESYTNIEGTELIPFNSRLDSNRSFYINIDGSVASYKVYRLREWSFVNETAPTNANINDYWLKYQDPDKKYIYKYIGNDLWEPIDDIIGNYIYFYLDPANNPSGIYARLLQYNTLTSTLAWIWESNVINTKYIVGNSNLKGTYITSNDSVVDNNYKMLESTYDYTLDSDTFNTFIRSNVTYDSGVLTLRFSDVKGGPNINNEFDKTQLYKETISTNFPFNDSKVVIDFNKEEYTVTKHDGTELEPIKLNTLDNYEQTYTIDGQQVTLRIDDFFKKSAKFMFTAYSQLNLLYKCTYYTYLENLILRADNNTVWKYDYIDTNYKQIPHEKPNKYLTGSHLSFNNTTNKLWYSDGRDIYQVGDITDKQKTIDKLEKRLAYLEELLNISESDSSDSL